jgi:ABC-type sugar transport system substrate-binding protein
MRNPHVAELFKRQKFMKSLETYPVGELAGGFKWKVGMGRKFIGPLSKLPINAPFSDYFPLKSGPVLDTIKTYRIGFTYHGAFHPWLISLADTAVYEANLHSNVEIDVYDAAFDNNKMANKIDEWVAGGIDAIVLWPVQETPMGPPVDRAVKAGIPVVSLDRRTSSKIISSEVLGNFYANGLQQGLFLNHITNGKGRMILNRKALGSTADSMRTGAFLSVIGNGDYEILGSFHTNSQRQKAFDATKDALKANENIQIVFNTGGEEALGALDAVRHSRRLNSTTGGKRTIFLANDDSKEALREVRNGKIDVVVPYTPLLGGIGVRVALQHIGHNAGLLENKPPRQVITPNLPMITKKKLLIDGIETVTPDEWIYAYGPEPMTLATVETRDERTRVSDRLLDKKKPGWFVELSRKASKQCGGKVSFDFLPWVRALALLEKGEIQAVFNSSYTTDRTNYGAYPLKDGVPDESRASKRYAYYVYANSSISDESLRKNNNINGRKVIAERGAAVIEELEKRNATIVTSTKYINMLRMLAAGRVDAAVGIEGDFDSILSREPALRDKIIKSQIPLQKRVGYVMFSKSFYAKHRDIVECFWTTSANLRETDWFREMQATYSR